MVSACVWYKCEWITNWKLILATITQKQGDICPIHNGVQVVHAHNKVHICNLDNMNTVWKVGVKHNHETNGLLFSLLPRWLAKFAFKHVLEKDDVVIFKFISYSKDSWFEINNLIVKTSM